MSYDDYKLALRYLDIIEFELNKIAKLVGHVPYNEWVNKL